MEVGTEPYTYPQRANDAFQLLTRLQIKRATIFGFSDGGYSALKLAALHPEVVTKVIALGIGDKPKDENKPPDEYSSEKLLAEAGGFFNTRLQLMPEPDRWDESLQFANHLYNNDYMSKETFEKIQCPVLIMNGEKDQYVDINSFTQVYKYIPNCSISMIPACDHVIFFCNFDAVWESMDWFLES